MEGIRPGIGTLFIEFRKKKKKKIHIRAVHKKNFHNQPEHIG
jgi:hypothetical protein